MTFSTNQNSEQSSIHELTQMLKHDLKDASARDDKDFMSKVIIPLLHS